MAARRSGRLDLQQAAAPPRVTRAPLGGILPRRTAADRAAEPRPRRFLADTSSSIKAPLDTNIVVDAKTGAAVITRGDGVTELDYSGRDSARQEKRPRSKGFNENLAERPEVQAILAGVIMDTKEDIEEIQRGRAEWEEMGAKGAELLGTRWEEASAGVGPDGTISKTRHPMLLEAVMRSWANSRAELLPAEGPVKVRDDATPEPTDESGRPGAGGASPNGGPPMGGVMPAMSGVNGGIVAGPIEVPGTPDRINLAMLLQKDMNHYLTKTDREYYGDVSRMLITRALKGSQFRKVSFDPVKRRPVSRWVAGTDLLISNDCSHISGASIVAERMKTPGNVAMRMMAVGAWRRVRLTRPSAQKTPTDRSIEENEGRDEPQIDRRVPYTIYEVRVDLDEGPLGADENGKRPGIALPYKLTFDWDTGECLALRRNWKKGDRYYRGRNCYVHYGFVPGLGYYHWGFIHILGNPERAATALLREFIDAEMLASFPGGAMQKGPGTRTNTTQIRPGPGQFQVVDTGGVPISEFMQAWQYKGASAQLNAVLSSIVENARRVAGTIELPVGEGRSANNIPGITVMAFVDAISKVPSAVHKDDHAAQQEEFELLKELLAEHPDCIEPHDRRSARRWTKTELLDANLVPAADPNSPSFVHRLMQGASLVQMAGLPQFAQIANQRNVWQLALAILGFGDRTQLTNPPQPAGAAPPDPKAMAQIAKNQTDQAKNQIAAQKLDLEKTDTQREAANQSLEAEQRQQDRASEERIESMRQETERLRLESEERRAREDTGHEDARHAISEGLEHQRHVDNLNREPAPDLNKEGGEGGEE